MLSKDDRNEHTSYSRSERPADPPDNKKHIALEPIVNTHFTHLECKRSFSESIHVDSSNILHTSLTRMRAETKAQAHAWFARYIPVAEHTERPRSRQVQNSTAMVFGHFCSKLSRKFDLHGRRIPRLVE
jgi:hypothetical protein